MNCARMGCGRSPLEVEVWESPIGRLLVVGWCKNHGEWRPPIPEGWQVVGGGGDPEVVHVLYHGRWRQRQG